MPHDTPLLQTAARAALLALFLEYRTISHARRWFPVFCAARRVAAVSVVSLVLLGLPIRPVTPFGLHPRASAIFGGALVAPRFGFLTATVLLHFLTAPIAPCGTWPPSRALVVAFEFDCLALGLGWRRCGWSSRARRPGWSCCCRRP